MKSIAAKLLAVLPWNKRASLPAPAAAIQQSKPEETAGTESAPAVTIAGSRNGWLRVLTAHELLQVVHGQRVIDKIYTQSRLSETVFARDFVPAIHAYCEFVQLAPASEAHHHAHVGGLLSHTLEMVLAAMTWRNGHLLPEGEVIEVIDAQRDHWTYVVFFAALLHDVAKPMTDLRISWRSKNMDVPLRWAPVAGSLTQVTQGRPESEYLVEFTPKAARDYSAHARLAQLLLPRIAPASAMSFLSMMPKALEALERYLTGADKDSLVAKIVKKADARSAQRALSHGSQARFATAKAVPLYDLLMQAIGAMLRSGTSLPLNRNGAAGWVYDGSVWFVAKRLADAVREWIHKNEPDQVVPGDTKNDRLFDTWQDYGVIERNPHTGQAVWYVHVEGHSQSEQGTYSHSLTMLRFPLAKLFADESQYPEAMTGRIVVRASRDGETEAIHDIETDAIVDADSHEHDATRQAGNPVQSDAVQASSDMKLKQGDDTLVDTEHQARPRKADAKPVVKSPVLKAPAFSKPSGAVKTAKPATEASGLAKASKQPSSPPQTASTSSIHHAEQNDELDAVDAAYLLESSILSDVRGGPSGMDALRAAASQYSNERKAEATTGKRPQTEAIQATTAAPKPAHAAAAKPTNAPQTASISPALAPISAIKTLSGLKPMTPLPKIVLGTGQPEVHAKSLDPVLLKQDLPRLSGQQAERQAEPSELATDFMRWVQQSLVDRSLKFNETGAAVHFVPEGMAVVSPLIFKQYAGTLTTDLSKVPEMAKQVQRDVIKADWHLPGPNKSNIVRYAVIRGQEQVSTLSVVVFVNAGRWVQPVPPSNPVLQLM